MTSLDIFVRNWAELDDVLHQDLNSATAGRHHAHLAYRGVACASWSTLTSLQRLEGDYSTLERHIIKDFRKYSYPHLAATASDWEVLTVGQHFGLPTRLLDWTFSPLVALHFATFDTSAFTEDAVIWMTDYRALHLALPTDLSNALTGENGESFSLDNLTRHIPTVEEFRTLAGDSTLLLFEPPSLDARVINQYAALGVASSAEADVAAILTGLGPTVARRVIVPAALKPEIRYRLDQDNITERMLFPGLDGLSKWLQRYYSPSAGLSRRGGSTAP